MSTLSGSVVAARGAAVRTSFASSPTSAYGRTAAYRRLSSIPRLSRATSSPKSAQPSVSSLSSSPILRNHLRPDNVVLHDRLFSTAPLLQVSFKEMREARAAERRGEKPSQKTEKKADAEAEAAAKRAEELLKEQQQRDKDAEAEEAYQKAKAQEEPESKGKEEEEPEAEEGKEGKEKKKEEQAAPPPHGDKTPWQVFTETLNTEFTKSKEWNESTKQLASGYESFTQNETLRRAKGARDAAATTTGAALSKTGKAIGQSAAWAWDTPVLKVVRAGVNATGRGIDTVTKPVRETEAYKNITKTIDDGSSSRYGGWMEKEERRKQREEREADELAKYGGRPPPEKMDEDPNAGTNVTLHKDARWKESWHQFRDSSRLMQSLFSLKSTYAESENPLISTARSISDRVAGFFAENETAMVIKKFREMDPVFQIEPFLQEMREYILPEVLDAYVKGDVETLKLWLSAAQYSVYAALNQQYTTAGLKSDGRILDIRHVDILSARMLDPGDIPVFILTCRTQEVHVYRNTKTGELAAGMDDKVQQVTYAIGVTRVPEDVRNAETRGWRLIELQKSARDYI